jgi:hypothetical protein
VPSSLNSIAPSNVTAVQGTIQLDDAAAAKEEKERLRVQRKANKLKRRDQARQKSTVESAEPDSGVPDIDRREW